MKGLSCTLPCRLAFQPANKYNAQYPTVPIACLPINASNAIKDIKYHCQANVKYQQLSHPTNVLRIVWSAVLPYPVWSVRMGILYFKTVVVCQPMWYLVFVGSQHSPTHVNCANNSMQWPQPICVSSTWTGPATFRTVCIVRLMGYAQTVLLAILSQIIPNKLNAYSSNARQFNTA